MKKLTYSELHRLQELWLQDWHASKRYEGGNAEQWFNCVLTFLAMRGDEIISAETRRQEEQLMSLGKSQEYLAALAEVVDLPPSANDYDQTMLVLTASPEERELALRKVMNNG